MTYTINKIGMISIEDARRILRAIFPNYPELKPCNPAPNLEPIAPPIAAGGLLTAPLYGASTGRV